MRQKIIILLIIISGCKSKEKLIESRIRDFTRIVFVQRDSINKKELESLLYIPNEGIKEKCMGCYKAIIDTIINQNIFVINKNDELKIWPYRSYPYRKPFSFKEYIAAKNIFVLKVNNDLRPIYFLIENGKIRSFYAMSKEHMEIYMFVTCC